MQNEPNFPALTAKNAVLAKKQTYEITNETYYTKDKRQKAKCQYTPFFFPNINHYPVKNENICDNTNHIRIPEKEFS